MREPIPIVRQAEENLATLATKINAEHDAGAKYLGHGLEHFRKAGELLLKAKDRHAAEGHGHTWTRWLSENVKTGLRQARRWMKLAREWDSSIIDSESDMPLEEAISILSQPVEEEQETAPPPSRDGSECHQPEPEVEAELPDSEKDDPPPTSEPAPPVEPLDGLGIPIPEPKRDVFGEEHEAVRADTLSLLRKLSKLLSAYASSPAGSYLAAELRRKGKDDENIRYEHEGLTALRYSLQQMAPHCSVCPYCLVEKDPGKKGRHCTCCHGLDWVPLRVFEKSQGLPDNCRAAVEALKAEGGAE